MTKVQEHLEEASAENAKIFHHLDTDGDGKCFLWSSYYNNSVEINCICLFWLPSGYFPGYIEWTVADHIPQELVDQEIMRFISAMGPLLHGNATFL